MKFLLIRERLRRQSFFKLEPQYLALKYISENQTFEKKIRWNAKRLLTKLIKKNSKVSFQNRCLLTGRGRGCMRFFNLSRIQIRELARNNKLFTIKKATW